MTTSHQETILVSVEAEANQTLITISVAKNVVTTKEMMVRVETSEAMQPEALISLIAGKILEVATMTTVLSKKEKTLAAVQIPFQLEILVVVLEEVEANSATKETTIRMTIMATIKEDVTTVMTMAKVKELAEVETLVAETMVSTVKMTSTMMVLAKINAVVAATLEEAVDAMTVTINATTLVVAKMILSPTDAMAATLVEVEETNKTTMDVKEETILNGMKATLDSNQIVALEEEDFRAVEWDVTKMTNINAATTLNPIVEDEAAMAIVKTI